MAMSPGSDNVLFFIPDIGGFTPFLGPASTMEVKGHSKFIGTSIIVAHLAGQLFQADGTQR